MNIHHGMNRIDLDRLLIALGGNVEHLRRTGEIAYHHPAIPFSPRANGRRKDASRHLTRFVRQVAEGAAMKRQGVADGACASASKPGGDNV